MLKLKRLIKHKKQHINKKLKVQLTLNFYPLKKLFNNYKDLILILN